MDAATHEVKILDTGYNYILYFKLINQCDDIDKLIIKLYDEINIEARMIDTDSKVNIDEQEFIINIMSKNIPYKIQDGSIPLLDAYMHKIKTDIEKIISFNSIKSHYSCNNSNINKLEKISKSIENYKEISNVINEQIQPFHQMQLNYSYISENENANLYNFSNAEMNNCNFNINYDEPGTNKLEEKYYILYNILYNISIYYVDSYNDIPQISKSFPEWVIIEKFDSLDETYIESCKKLFNKKSFSDITSIYEKVKSFKSLFVATVNEKESELEIIKHYINSSFIINDNPNNKIKLSELINFIPKHLTQSQLFKKRFNSYLLELNLTKKRFSDGYYVFGLIPKFDLKELV